MYLLLDTHIFIWLDSHSAQLSPAATTALGDSTNTLFLSVASLWEMQIKINLGRLPLRLPLRDIVTEQQQINGVRLLSVRASHTFALDGLPRHHKDPFDRLLMAQAIAENMTVVSADSIFRTTRLN